MEGVEQPTPLALAADHRCPGALGAPARVGRDRDEAMGFERLALALDRQRSNWLGLHRVTDQAERVAPEQDVSGACRLLEPCGDVDDVPRREVASARAGAGDGLARVDADPHGKLDAAFAAQLSAKNSRLIAHLRCRSHGAQGVVLVRDRDPEDSHDRVADVVLDRPAMTLDGDAHAGKPALHCPPQRLGVHLLSKRSRSHDVREHDGDDLAPLARGRRPRQRCAAPRAESGSARRPLSTARARLHGPSLDPPAGAATVRRRCISRAAPRLQVKEIRTHWRPPAMPEHPHPAASMVTPQLDAYPRLCGLPVTVERVAARPARVTRRWAAASRPSSSWPPWYSPARRWLALRPRPRPRPRRSKRGQPPSSRRESSPACFRGPCGLRARCRRPPRSTRPGERSRPSRPSTPTRSTMRPSTCATRSSWQSTCTRTATGARARRSSSPSARPLRSRTMPRGRPSG